MTNRIYPTCPRAGVSLALFRDNRVLLARRGAQSGFGLCSLPGGLIELGETAEAAALREICEEVGVTGRIVGLAGHTDIIEHESKAVRQHYIVLTFAGHWLSGEPRTSPEATEYLWADINHLSGLQMTKGLPVMLRRCADLVGCDA